tara:strand:- start:453 stop:1241 length:789 start_codon:yes stop_codon:yes gene_type:complete
MSVFLYPIIGAVAGLLAGLFGVGGGAIIVPILIFMFTLQGFPAASIVHLAIGTSFATIVITSTSSVFAHHKLGNVNWPVVKAMAPGLMVGVVLGSTVAAGISGDDLQLLVGIFLLVAAAQLFSGAQPKAAFGLPSRAVLALFGGVIGSLSAFFGIGGGTLTVPTLTACRESMHAAVATSGACGMPIAFFGALTYGWHGASAELLPALTTGYIYWPAFFGIALLSMPFARWGAALSTHLSERHLKRLFAVLLLFIAIQLLLSR